ncbi:MAG: AAA family ATPase [Desulfobacterales bacterium]|nr:MAG: AAA family ATPase [Desulfobacterales bacterium]
MYNNFFGFKEKPFKLVPNPEYFFLSKCHEEALAHLNYAISQGDGFVQITGEVGTGKTTLCRTFLESLNSRTKAAYIFNPKLGPKQLLMSINDEFGIKSDSETTKELIDTLNTFLMRNRAKGNKVILLIDEAQNLSQNVLEQLRLLSNLETNKDKLLQIILVGQPELAEMLDSYELRQIGQRITLSYHLTPLSFRETKEYIQYRINIAAQRKGIKFDQLAYYHIFKYSKGIPRLINIVCDRALLTGFVLNQHKITGNILKASIRELSGPGRTRNYGFADGRKGLVLISLLAVALLVAIYHQPLMNRIHKLLKSGGPQKTEIIQSLESEIQTANTSPKIQSFSKPLEASVSKNPLTQITTVELADYLKNMNVQASRYFAFKFAMDLWNVNIDDISYLVSIDDDQSFFQLSANPRGLTIHRVESDMNLLMSLNLPAILEFYPPGSPSPGYLTLSKIEGNHVELGGAGEDSLVVTDLNEIEFYWTGVAYIPWKNFLSILGTIPTHSYKDSVITLKLLLQDIGFTNFEINADYDDATQTAIENIQAKYGVPVDGFVGPLTKIILYREKKSFEMPQVIRQ